MAIPGAVTNTVLYNNPTNADNTFGGNFLNVANQMLKNYQAQQAQKESEYGKLFPVLAQMNMLQPVDKKTPGGVQYPNNSGMFFKPTPTTNPDQTLKNLEVQKLNTQLGNIPQTDSAAWQSALNETYKNYQSNYMAQAIAEKSASDRGMSVDDYLKGIAYGLYQSQRGGPTSAPKPITIAVKGKSSQASIAKAKKWLQDNKAPITDANISAVINQFNY